MGLEQSRWILCTLHLDSDGRRKRRRRTQFHYYLFDSRLRSTLKLRPDSINKKFLATLSAFQSQNIFESVACSKQSACLGKRTWDGKPCSQCIRIWKTIRWWLCKGIIRLSKRKWPWLATSWYCWMGRKIDRFLDFRLHRLFQENILRLWRG